MLKATIAQRAEALLVQAVLGFLGALPAAAASNFGGLVARIIGPQLPVSGVADRNLMDAMPELDRAGRRKIVREVWDNLGRTVAELTHIGELRETSSGPGYQLSGWEHVEGGLKNGGPSIFFGGHIGNWEITPPAAFIRGVDVGFMYRAASNPLVNGMIQRLREAKFGRNITMFPKGDAGARAAFAHLGRKRHLGILIDQKLDNGIAVPFFGLPAMTAPALASFALKFRCPVFPVHVVRTGPARLHIICDPPMTLPDTGDHEADVLALTAATNDVLERWIREKPGAWLWLHNRWPKS
jgi:KDO2-lipid IV(A) lauroyltransferase